MGQIVGTESNIFRCNLLAIQSGGSQANTVLAADEVWLIDTTNSLTNSLSGNCDCYIIGDGTTAATELPLQMIDGNEMVEFTEDVNISDYSTIYAFPSSSNKWIVNTNNYKGKFIPCSSGDIFSVTANSSVNTSVCFLQDMNYASAQPVNYADGYSGTGVVIDIGQTQVFTAPSNATYMYIAVQSSAGDRTPSSVINIIHKPISEYLQEADNEPVEGSNNLVLSGGVYALIIKKAEEIEYGTYDESLIDLSLLNEHSNSINSSQVWTTTNTCKFIPVISGYSYKIKSDKTAVFAWLKTDSIVVNKQASFCDDYPERINSVANEEYTYIAPDDAGYIYVVTTTSAGNITWEVEEGRIILSGLRNDVNHLNNTKAEKFIKEINVDISELKKYTSYIANEVWSDDSRYDTCFVPLTSGVKYSLVDSTSSIRIAILKTNTITQGESPDFCDDYPETIVLSQGQNYVFEAPSDAHYLYLVRKSSTKTLNTEVSAEYNYTLSVINEEQEAQNTEIKNLESSVDKVNSAFYKEWLDISPYTVSKFFINERNVWAQNNSVITALIPIQAGREYSVNSESISFYMAILKDASYTVGATPNFCDDYPERMLVDINSSYSFIAPEDANYLYVLVHSSTAETNCSVFKTCFAYSGGGSQGSVSDYASNTLLKRIIESLGNTLHLTDYNLDENSFEIPFEREILNVQKKSSQMTDLAWTPINDIPGPRSSTLPAGQTVTGLPYSSVKELDKFVGLDVSFHTYMTAVNNPYSLLYTENVLGSSSQSAWGKTYNGIDNCSCYYGIVCSSFTAYCTGQDVQWSTGEDKWVSENRYNMIKTYDQSAQGLKIGDILWQSGHNMLVLGLKRDSDGNVIEVQMSEANGYKAVKRMFTAEEFETYLASNQGVMYRNTELYKNIYKPIPFVAVGDETVTPFVYNDDICTFAGDKATFREGDTIVIDYNLKNVGSWTQMEIYKNNTLLETINIDSSAHYVNLTSKNLSYGSYKARLTDGSSYSDYTYWEVIQANVTHSFDEGISHITWESANGLALSYTICNVAGTVYAHDMLTEENIANGYCNIDLVKLNRAQYPPRKFTSGMFLKIHFQGEYGRVTNEPLSVSFT